jgi:MscS family membrane protein
MNCINLRSITLRTIAFTALLLSMGWTPAATSQPAVQDSTSARTLLEAEQKAEQLIEEKSQTDPRSIDTQSTPLASMLSLRQATRDLDWEKAGEFLDRRYLPDDMEQWTDMELLKALSHVWGQQNIIDLNALSDSPEGELNDGLPSYRDQIGVVVLSDEEIPVFLQRVPDGKGNRVWKLSNTTVARIPDMWEELGYGPLAVALSKLLPDFRFMGMANWQLVATVIFFIVAWPLAVLASYILMRLALLVPNRLSLGIQRFFRGPMRFFLFIWIARLLTDQLGLSLTARILLDSIGINYIAFTVLLLGVLSLWRDYQIRKIEHAGNIQYVALLRPFTRIVKVVAVIVVALYWANEAGYNMTTVLGALGVGSLAVALAAQKTLENVIGAITLYTARPVRAGDFCRFGTVLGTVEEIGLRSTLIRTLDRTMVVIPNAVFSATEIENFSHRDRIRYFRQYRMRLRGAEQMRYVLAEIRKLMLGHPRVLQETVSVRFENIEDGNAVLRLDAGVDTNDFQDYLAVAEDLNLRIVEIAEASGATFTGPGQLVHLHESEPASPDQQARFEQALREMRDQERLPFPDYSEEERENLRNSLDYPPKGSPT